MGRSLLPPPAPRIRLWLEWAILAAVLAIAIAVAAAQGWFRRLDAAVYDYSAQHWDRAPAADIVVVGVDEESLAQLGRWPWRRSIHATLLPHLAGARAVLLDFILAEEGSHDPGEDALAGAIARHGRVVLPVHAVARPDGTADATLPSASLRSSAAALGHIQLDGNGDGVIRRINLYEGPHGARWPHVALALLQVAVAAKNSFALSPTSRAPTTIGERPSSWTTDQPSLIAYVGGAGSFTTVSYISVLRGDVPDTFFRDKFVLVGAASVGMGDLHATPAARDGGLMSGVEIIANVLQQQKDGIAVRTAAPRAVLVTAVGIVLAALFAGVFLPAGARLLLTCALVIAMVWGAAVVLRTWHAWWPPATAVIALLAAFPLWSWRRLAAAEAFVDAELVQLDAVLGRGAGANLGSGDPLEKRIGAIQRANDEIRSRTQERDEMLSFLSHDLRSPQVSIIALANLYRDGRKGAIDEGFWDRLTGYANQTLSLADDFVQLARAEHIATESLLPINLGETMADAADGAWAGMHSKGMTLHSKLSPDAWALGDRVLLTRAFRNLIDNAVKHGPAGSAISVVIERIANDWQCSVADRGPGVAPDEREAVFNRYHIASDTNVRKAGAGLGLALVRAVAHRCRGRSFVDDAASGGARFSIVLPVLPRPA